MRTLIAETIGHGHQFSRLPPYGNRGVGGAAGGGPLRLPPGRFHELPPWLAALLALSLATLAALTGCAPTQVEPHNRDILLVIHIVPREVLLASGHPMQDGDTRPYSYRVELAGKTYCGTTIDADSFEWETPAGIARVEYEAWGRCLHRIPDWTP